MVLRLLRYIIQSARTHVVIIVICVMSQAACAADRLPAQTLFDPGNRNALADYVRERLLKIEITARDKRTKKDVTSYGTGFLVSTEGHAITAAHVLEPYFDVAHFEFVPNAKTPKSVKIQKARGESFAPLQIDTSFRPQISPGSDIALFKVKTETDLKYQTHLCVDVSDPRPRISDSRLRSQNHPVSVAAWRQADGQLQSYPITITQTAGPTLPGAPGNGLSERWVAKEQFHNSMSGGAVLLDGKVVGVVVAGLQDQQTGDDIATAANYVSLLHFAEIDWRHRSEICDPTSSGAKYTEFVDLSAFLGGTAEGSLAWVSPQGAKRYWALDKGHDFVLRRSDLGCRSRSECACSASEMEQSGAEMRFVLNHFSKCTTSNTDLEAPTFYGVQVVPIIKEDETPTPEVWPFRNADLLMRDRSGTFYMPGPLDDPEYLDGTMFNRELDKIFQDSINLPLQKCGPALSIKQCKDLDSIEKLETLLGRRWHGFTREGPDVRSTVWATRWMVPPSWFGTTATVKNFILRYTGTDSPNSQAPVDFAVCVPTYWSGVRIKVFSPERRCATPIDRKITFHDD